MLEDVSRRRHLHRHATNRIDGLGTFRRRLGLFRRSGSELPPSSQLPSTRTDPREGVDEPEVTPLDRRKSSTSVRRSGRIGRSPVGQQLSVVFRCVDVRGQIEIDFDSTNALGVGFDEFPNSLVAMKPTQIVERGSRKDERMPELASIGRDHNPGPVP